MLVERRAELEAECCLSCRVLIYPLLEILRLFRVGVAIGIVFCVGVGSQLQGKRKRSRERRC